MRLLLNWLVSALSLLLVAHLVPGFAVSSLWSALLAVIVIGFVNATLGFALKILTLPLTFLTLGIFWWVVNALMLWLASAFVPGFTIAGLGSAFLGAIVLALINMAFHWLLPRPDRPARA